MDLLTLISTILVIKISVNKDFFSIHRILESICFLSHAKVLEKIRKIKFDIKIKFLTTRGTNHLLKKKKTETRLNV
jgi:hypothetical protein